MKNSIFIIGIILIIFSSCSKEKTPITTPDSVLDYFPLKKGNYWVYKVSYLDSAGNTISQSRENDSMVIGNDILINNKTYITVIHYNYLGATNSDPFIVYYRDSSDCIVNNYGKIIFSINSGVYKEIFHEDSSAYINYSFVSQATNITVPIGTYNCLDYKGELYRKSEQYKIAFLTHNYCYKNIGTIRKVMLYIGSLDKVNLDLIKYHIQ
ncbi:MAG: hypothetical protein Q8M15_11100 [Bacteroidota bacterium]|nr:hypothetical protein [Bacteroidota bacterium]